tara:strand:- start:382 stop:615 length:234 start_codon:yes stop_codon:yes gene_type:complete
MIIYQISQMDAHQGCVRHWAKSKADLCRVKAKVRAAYRANGNQKDFNGWVGPHKHEIGKGKDGLVEFLNLHARLDNG